MTDFELGEGLFDIFDTEEDDNAPREHLGSSVSRSLPTHLEERQKSNFVGLRNQCVPASFPLTLSEEQHAT